jgi:glutathione synthase/RimK-type ligase-like ATP-grasp enzyme
MKIALHHTGKGGFSERWLEYLKEINANYKIVNCYDTNIIEQLDDCQALMWHFSHLHPKDTLFAKQLLMSLEQAGLRTFPNTKTMWHFDDKVGQKYLLESMNAPIVCSEVFYSKKEALSWLYKQDFPLVFKLRGGAGSVNVKLVKNINVGKKLVLQSFGKGFKNDSIVRPKEIFNKLVNGKASFLSLLKSCYHYIIPSEFARNNGKERGYAYFQKFIPNNNSDIRVIVIGEKAFAIKRMVRKNDFRASGSGTILYDKALFDIDTIKLALETAKTLKSQCVAFDFVYQNNIPLIVEISYGFNAIVYDDCQGYWDKNLVWHEGAINPYGWMVDSLMK